MLNPASTRSDGGSDVEAAKSSAGQSTLRYDKIDHSKLKNFLPVKPKEGPYVINSFRKPKSAKEILHDHPEWEGAPVSQDDVKKNVERIKKMAAFESLDFDYIDSDLERQRDLNRHHGDYFLVYFWRWFICILIGFVMGVIAFFVDWGIEALNTMKYMFTDWLINSRTSFVGPFFVYVGISAALATVAGSLVSFVSPFGRLAKTLQIRCNLQPLLKGWSRSARRQLFKVERQN
eukprot:TRINITY_DN9335_c0_g1_i4.p1 TRINITY_DN9335_c0_g1~~TRINITY_DN9335_c0_g1_i4.p1  ORF type:complete len:233 (+),score=28.12 TRINITY_DN9335_c0_g1_i4:107-805(+)